MVRSSILPYLVFVCLNLILFYALIAYPSSENLPKSPNPILLSETKPVYEAGRDQNDPELLSYIKSLLMPPSGKPYSLKNPKRKHFTAFEQSTFVGDLYGPAQREGFFLEVGAFDGEESSSTLYLERELGFKGLLIEPSPINWAKLVKKQRKSFLLNAALSPTTTAEELIFTGSGQQGHLVNAKSRQSYPVKAFPLYAILQALNITFIDVFNLDIEGFEFKVLNTIPWNEVKLGIMIVEHLNIPEPHEEVVKFMESTGYQKIHENHFDYIFADPNYLKKLKG
ncbi:hypothetical protein SK128_012523 [Halocaridina rubra]|uniref:Methyltransferase FkbM domain-containing protein n=1 Tax=Halocaridina rubra TaxID=373956 RepID=A0AAN9A7Z0_HALRR